jgi:parvulin-like peptidyl-prolyl isomerase
MNKSFVHLVVVGLLGVAAAWPAGAVKVDEILATVDDREVILYSEILAEVRPAIEVMQAQVPANQLEREIDKLVNETIDSAIENRLLLRQAVLAGLQVNEEAMEERIDGLESSFPDWTRSELRTHVRRQALARQMARIKMMQFENNAVVSESEVAQYYQDHQGESPFTHLERLRVRQIFMAGHGKSEVERRRIRAQLAEIRDEIEMGGDFVRLAQAFSEAVGAKQGGIIGWVSQGDLVPDLEETIFALEVGKVSEVIETQGGFHVVRVETREPAGVKPLEEARADIEPILRRQVAEERYRKWMADLRKRSRIQLFI